MVVRALESDDVAGLVREHYSDFGPTLAQEKLEELHDICVTTETLRQWMIRAGVWQTRKQRRKRIQQPRHRRDCYGELVQIDGSDHHWFEDRGPRCVLLVYIDDATGRLMELRMCVSESAFSYFEATRAYLMRHGKSVAFYSDKASVFRVNAKNNITGDRYTQFGRAMSDLNIDIICANTPAAKGRVERANQTLHYKRIMYIVDPTEEAKDAAKKRVLVVETKDGDVRIMYKGKVLPAQPFHKEDRRVTQASRPRSKQAVEHCAYRDSKTPTECRRAPPQGRQNQMGVGCGKAQICRIRLGRVVS